MTRDIIRRAPMCSKIYRDALEPDTRTLEHKANDDAIMSIRGKINDLLTVEDSFDFVFAMTDAENKWDVINSEKWSPIAKLAEAISQVCPEYGMSIYRLEKAKDAARAAGWTVRGGGWGGRYEVEFSG